MPKEKWWARKKKGYQNITNSCAGIAMDQYTYVTASELHDSKIFMLIAFFKYQFPNHKLASKKKKEKKKNGTSKNMHLLYFPCAAVPPPSAYHRHEVGISIVAHWISKRTVLKSLRPQKKKRNPERRPGRVVLAVGHSKCGERVFHPPPLLPLIGRRVRRYCSGWSSPGASRSRGIWTFKWWRPRSWPSVRRKCSTWYWTRTGWRTRASTYPTTWNRIGVRRIRPPPPNPTGRRPGRPRTVRRTRATRRPRGRLRSRTATRCRASRSCRTRWRRECSPGRDRPRRRNNVHGDWLFFTSFFYFVAVIRTVFFLNT